MIRHLLCLLNHLRGHITCQCIAYDHQLLTVLDVFFGGGGGGVGVGANANENQFIIFTSYNRKY